MQADRFTVKSQEAVAAAQELARTRSNPEIATAHLLLALLDQAESMAVAVLQRVGGDPATVRAGATDAIGKLPTVSGGEEPRMSSNLGRVVRGAEGEMAKFGDSYITVGHLLLALAEDGSGVSDLLPDRVELERAVKAVQGPAKVNSPNAEDNAQAPYRVDPTGPYGPNTCVQGYVWREARASDVVCVTPDERTQVAYDNSQAQSRIAP